jgi:hypothetical protein
MLEVSQYPTSNYTIDHNNKNSMVLAQNKYEDQWNRIEDPDLNPHSYVHHIFDQGAKNTMEKGQPLQLLSSRRKWAPLLLGILDICLQKTETRSMFVTLYKYQFKVD